jgi:hypothetical protein
MAGQPTYINWVCLFICMYLTPAVGNGMATVTACALPDHREPSWLYRHTTAATIR